MKHELQALALDVILRDDEGNEIDLSKIDGDDSQPSVKPQPQPPVDVKDESEEEEDDHSESIDDLETPLFTDGDEE